jgi:hypothetical protein
VVELCTALIVSCVPALSGYYTGVLTKAPLYNRLAGAFSRSFRQNQSRSSRITPDMESGSDDWARYNELDDVNSAEMNSVKQKYPKTAKRRPGGNPEGGQNM